MDLEGMTPPSRDANAPGLCMNLSPRKTEGAGKAGCPPHPQPRVQNKTKHTSVVTTGSPVSPGLPCAMVLTVSFELLCPQNLVECANGRFSPTARSLDLSPFVLEGPRA